MAKGERVELAFANRTPLLLFLRRQGIDNDGAARLDSLPHLADDVFARPFGNAGKALRFGGKLARNADLGEPLVKDHHTVPFGALVAFAGHPDAQARMYCCRGPLCDGAG